MKVLIHKRKGLKNIICLMKRPRPDDAIIVSGNCGPRQGFFLPLLREEWRPHMFFMGIGCVCIFSKVTNQIVIFPKLNLTLTIIFVFSMIHYFFCVQNTRKHPFPFSYFHPPPPQNIIILALKILLLSSDRFDGASRCCVSYRVWLPILLVTFIEKR